MTQAPKTYSAAEYEEMKSRLDGANNELWCAIQLSGGDIRIPSALLEIARGQDVVSYYDYKPGRVLATKIALDQELLDKRVAAALGRQQKATKGR